MNNAELLAYVRAEIQRLRALDGPCARFLRVQLERTEQLLRFTGAHTSEDFAARVECNEEWVKEECFARGYAEGRASFGYEIAQGVLPN